jgi:hypothetical protein
MELKTKMVTAMTSKKKAAPKTAPKKTATKAPPTKQVWPKITVGSHLTVTEFEDGSTVLAWDDAKLLEEVREATK